MLIKVWSKHGQKHLWAYENFKEEVKATLIDYDLNGNIIKSITYSVQGIIPQEVFDKYGFAFSIVDEKVFPTKELKQNIPTISISIIDAKCAACLFWDDEKERCERFGGCYK